MGLPLIGSFEGTVVGSAPASIHGDTYFDLLLVPAGTPVPQNEAEVRAVAVHARLPAHLCPTPPRAGARVRLNLLMGQVTDAAWR